MGDEEEPPEVISISYGSVELAVGQDQLNTFDTQAQKLGLMGVTLLAASGDDGAAGASSIWRDGNPECQDTEKYGLLLNWPAGSQYVTAVGATAGIESDTAEVTCQLECSNSDYASTKSCFMENDGPIITSGGGISSFTPKPSWQESHNPCSRRGIPDLSLAGHSYNIVAGGQQEAVDGTSASTPVFAAWVSLVNARRKAAGKSTVGFINPTLYINQDAFNDITVGDNKCAGLGSRKDDGSVPCCGGYDAAKGWDAATGLGSLDFDKFEAMFDNADQVYV